jgi:hypothetical protein
MRSTYGFRANSMKPFATAVCLPLHSNGRNNANEAKTKLAPKRKMASALAL